MEIIWSHVAILQIGKPRARDRKGLDIKAPQSQRRGPSLPPFSHPKTLVLMLLSRPGDYFWSDGLAEARGPPRRAPGLTPTLLCTRRPSPLSLALCSTQATSHVCGQWTPWREGAQRGNICAHKRSEVINALVFPLANSPLLIFFHSLKCKAPFQQGDLKDSGKLLKTTTSILWQGFLKQGMYQRVVAQAWIRNRRHSPTNHSIAHRHPLGHPQTQLLVFGQAQKKFKYRYYCLPTI